MFKPKQCSHDIYICAQNRFAQVICIYVQSRLDLCYMCTKECSFDMCKHVCTQRKVCLCHLYMCTVFSCHLYICPMQVCSHLYKHKTVFSGCFICAWSMFAHDICIYSQNSVLRMFYMCLKYVCSWHLHIFTKQCSHDICIHVCTQSRLSLWHSLHFWVLVLWNASFLLVLFLHVFSGFEETPDRVTHCYNRLKTTGLWSRCQEIKVIAWC